MLLPASRCSSLQLFHEGDSVGEVQREGAPFLGSVGNTTREPPVSRGSKAPLNTPQTQEFHSCPVLLFQLKASWGSWKVGKAPGAARSHKELCQTSPGTAEELLDQSWAHPAVPKLCRSNSQRSIQTTAVPLRSTQTGITSFTLSTWLENRPSERAWIHLGIYSIKFHLFAIWKESFQLPCPPVPCFSQLLLYSLGMVEK